MTNTDEFMEDALGGETPKPESEEKANVVVQPLSDPELDAGSMKKQTCWIRVIESNGSIRQKRKRKKRKNTGRREINVVAADTEVARKFMREMAATTIRDADPNMHEAPLQPVIEAVVSNSEYRSLISDLSSRPDVLEAVRAAWRNPSSPAKQQRFGIRRMMERAKRILAQSIITKIGKRVVGWLLKLLPMQRSR